ncbi:MAG: GNAT family N-acetyltransferase [Faecalibacterium sp.]|nr:GNAT family N-acetyltransferase [Faecalibacterium sp.]
MLSVGDTADADKAKAFEVWRIYVDPAFQGKGVGSQMLDFAEKIAGEQGYSEIVIWAFKQNTRAVSFCQKHGYCLEKGEYLGEPFEAFGVRLAKRIFL